MQYTYTLDKCLKCDTQLYNHEETEYCIECGSLLENHCFNEECSLYDELPLLPINAKHCPFCGSETFFKEQGFFDN